MVVESQVVDGWIDSGDCSDTGTNRHLMPLD